MAPEFEDALENLSGPINQIFASDDGGSSLQLGNEFRNYALQLYEETCEKIDKAEKIASSNKAPVQSNTGTESISKLAPELVTDLTQLFQAASLVGYNAAKLQAGQRF